MVLSRGFCGKIGCSAQMGGTGGLALGKKSGMCFARRSTVRVKQVGHETLVLDDEVGQIHQLNQTASFIWQQCDGKTSEEVIARRLAARFAVEFGKAARDVVAALRNWRAQTC